MANAQAILQGKITPYAYDYSLPPLGWIQIAGWVKLTGGIASFGNAINSGRVLMLVMAGTSSLLLYLVTRRLSGSRGAALLAMLLYTLSPLSLFYRDQVLPYNIGIFWLLLSLWLVTISKSRLGMFALSAAALSIAVLSDGLFLIFLPVMLYAVAVYATPFQRKFSQVAFAYVTLAIGSVYVLLALLSERIPAFWQLSGASEPDRSGVSNVTERIPAFWQLSGKSEPDRGIFSEDAGSSGRPTVKRHLADLASDRSAVHRGGDCRDVPEYSGRNSQSLPTAGRVPGWNVLGLSDRQ